MRKWITVSGFCFCAVVQAQSIDPIPVWTVRNNPLALLQGQMIGAGELTIIGERKYALRESIWFGTGFSYLTFIGRAFWHALLTEAVNNPNSEIDIIRGLGFRLIVGQRWYFDQDGYYLEGFHFGPILSAHFFYMPFTVDNEPFTFKYRIFNFLLPVGYTVYLTELFSFDVLLGYNYRLHIATITYQPRNWLSITEPVLTGHWLWFSFYVRWTIAYSGQPR